MGLGLLIDEDVSIEVDFLTDKEIKKIVDSRIQIINGASIAWDLDVIQYTVIESHFIQEEDRRFLYAPQIVTIADKKFGPFYIQGDAHKKVNQLRDEHVSKGLTELNGKLYGIDRVITYTIKREELDLF